MSLFSCLSSIFSPILNASCIRLCLCCSRCSRCKPSPLKHKYHIMILPAASFHTTAHKPSVLRHESEESTSYAVLANRLWAPNQPVGLARVALCIFLIVNPVLASTFLYRSGAIWSMIIGWNAICKGYKYKWMILLLTIRIDSMTHQSFNYSTCIILYPYFNCIVFKCNLTAVFRSMCKGASPECSMTLATLLRSVLL